jgi:hypothetical protein
MDGEPEGALQIGLQIADAPGGALAPPLLDIGKDLRRQLVPLLRPATLRQQTGEPFRREGGLCLIRCRQRHTEQLRSHGHRHFLDMMPAHHLVAHLQQVARVEEAAPAEQSTTACGLRLSVPVALSAASLASAARMRLDGPLVNYAAPRSTLPLFDVFSESIPRTLRELCHIIPGMRQN